MNPQELAPDLYRHVKTGNIYEERGSAAMDDSYIKGSVYRHITSHDLCEVIYKGMGVVKGVSDFIVILRSIEHGHMWVISCYDFPGNLFAYESKINH